MKIHKDFPLPFSSISFILLGSVCSSVIYFELISVGDLDQCGFFPPYGHQISPAPFIEKDHPFSIELHLQLSQNQFSVCVWVYF